MIYFVKRNQIDEEKYNNCIATSLQSRVYAYSWYLDVVADNWSVLVLDNYDAVMPLPFQKKHLISYISQPFFTQQLGVFSAEETSKNTIEEFLKKIPRKFLKITVQLNSENKFSEEKSSTKKNYILSLDKEYKTLYKGFSKGRKHAIQQGLKEQFAIEEISFSEVLKLSNQHYSFKEVTAKEYEKLTKLVAVLKSKSKVKILGIKLDKKLIGGSVFASDSKRIIYLFSAVSRVGKEKQVASLLLNDVIKKHSNSELFLDFEGSQIPGIAKFFKSFGAKSETYFLLKKWLL
ncbi:hypothetical protein KCTC32516_00248 [Polaribacter huanghezhanensis]|uniref:hypothetical protein n=1 Tax=Polaribacter huanghezhanensis TaxID=1354726 RepID=UPI0026499FCA|nr:hypothetical protein [Polaribacter huanghezhanensis]WKD84912.1 hypothetical protein KCTC32516_00248 [Polaribacter huanghezhanensis]